MAASVRDKHGVLTTLGDRKPVVIELGCGNHKSHPEALGVDALDSAAVDLVGDAIEVLRCFSAASVQRVTSSHFLEHVVDLDGLLAEVSRVLVDNGTFDAVVPHFSNPYFYSDPTHRRTFGLYSFAYLAEGSGLHRGVPRYGKDFGLVIDGVDLVFTSPFTVRRWAKRAWGGWVNLGAYTRELYEENLCYLVPCYEVRYTLHRRARTSAP